MGIFDKIAKNYLVGKGLMVVPNWDRGEDVFSSYGHANLSLLDLYKSAYSRVNLIARKISSLDINLYRDGTDTIVQNHALLNLINNPGGMKSDTTKDDLIEAIVSSIKVCDQTFIIFKYDKNSKYPISASVALPGSVTEDRDGTIIRGFRYEDKLLAEREYIRISGWSPLSNVKGLSSLSTIKNYLSTDQAIAAHELAFFNNNAIPAGAMVIEADKLTFDKVKQDWKEKFEGSSNNNKLAFIRKDPGKDSAALEYQQYTTDNRSLDLQVIFDRIDKKIDEAFGVPKEMMGNITATNLAGVKMAKAIFWENVGIPDANKIVAKFNRWIKVNFPNDKVKFAFDTPDFEDYEKVQAEANIKKTKAETASILINAGFDSASVLNEVGINNIKVSQPVNLKSETKQLTKPKKILSVIKQKNIVPEDNPDEFAALRNALYSHLDNQYDTVRELEDPTKLDFTSQAIALAATLLPVLTSIYNKVGSQQMAHLLEVTGLPTDTLQFELTRSLELGLTSYSQRVSSSFETDTQVALKNLVDTANELSWTAAQKNKEIRHYYKSQGEYIQQGGKLIKNNARYRADRLVITESIRANNQASLKSIQDISSVTGNKYLKIWRRTSSIPEPICDYFNGKVIGIFEPFAELGQTIDIGNEKKFVNNFATLHTPDPHPFCRCEIEYKEIT